MFFYITEPRVKITYVCDNKNDLELKTINECFFNFFSSVISNSSDTDLIWGNQCLLWLQYLGLYHLKYSLVQWLYNNEFDFHPLEYSRKD